jgi:hypothetical protein
MGKVTLNQVAIQQGAPFPAGRERALPLKETENPRANAMGGGPLPSRKRNNAGISGCKLHASVVCSCNRVASATFVEHPT